MMRRWVSWVVAHPWVVIGAVVLATIGIGARLERLRRDVDLDKLLPPDHPYVKIHDEIEDHFGGRNVVVLAVVPESGDASPGSEIRANVDVIEKHPVGRCR